MYEELLNYCVCVRDRLDDKTIDELPEFAVSLWVRELYLRVVEIKVGGVWGVEVPGGEQDKECEFPLLTVDGGRRKIDRLIGMLREQIEEIGTGGEIRTAATEPAKSTKNGIAKLSPPKQVKPVPESRQRLIVAAIESAGEPIQWLGLAGVLKLKHGKAKLKKELACMVRAGILINESGWGYWLADRPLPTK